jgi:kinetochore protein Spc25
MHAAIASITAQRDARAAVRDRLRAEIMTTKKQIAQKLAAQQQHAKDLDAQARFNAPELNFWTEYLCLRIEGAGRVDRLKFVFTHVDERDWQQEAWFELDTERRDYAVTTARPKLETEDVARCLGRLNDNRDLGMFLGSMRELFVKALK